MKSFRQLAAVAIALVGAAAFAEPAAPLLIGRELPRLAEPSFQEALDASFAGVKGKWIPQGGVLSVVDIPAEKHIPVLHHMVGLSDAVIECEFRFDGPGSFLVGCDSDKHVGRVVINAQGLSLAEDSVKPSHTIAKEPMPVSQGTWHQLRVEWTGDRIGARLDGKELKAQHPFLATPKSRSWLAASQTVKVRNLRISGEKTASSP